ncbi:MAG: hypothetical protein KC418_13370 [Anaerolineales bacterium]|nr:hypothetical protein [Anaerolineales bacterium]
MFSISRISAALFFLFIIMFTTGCASDYDIRNIHNETRIGETLEYPINNCGSSTPREISQEFSQLIYAGTIIEERSGVQITSGDRTEMKRYIEKYKGYSSGSVKETFVHHTFDADPNSNVIYTIQRRDGWEIGTIYNVKTGRNIADYAIRTGLFTLGIIERREEACR